MNDSQECADLISQIQDGRVFSRKERAKENKRKAHLYKNPGGGELEGRYGHLFANSNTLHALFKHFGLSSILNVNLCGASWYYNNQVFPSHAGVLWGREAMEIKETDPDNFIEAMHQREMTKLREIANIEQQIIDTRAANMLTPARFEQLEHKRDSIRARPVIRRIHTFSWPVWNFLPNMQVEEGYAMVRCHKLDREPELVGALGDKGRENRKRDVKGNLLKAWEHYAAVIQMKKDSTGLRLHGWMSPDKIRFYEAKPMKEEGQDILFYKVPLDDLEPMASLLECLQGWNLEKLVADKKLFLK